MQQDPRFGSELWTSLFDRFTGQKTKVLDTDPSEDAVEEKHGKLEKQVENLESEKRSLEEACVKF